MTGRPATIWIGGAPGAGKSTIARALSRAHDLPLHPIDLWTCDHHVRMSQTETPDEQLARGPDAAAELWQRDVGLVALSPYPFACECGRSRCRSSLWGTPDSFAGRAAAAAGAVLAEGRG